MDSKNSDDIKSVEEIKSTMNDYSKSLNDDIKKDLESLLLKSDAFHESEFNRADVIKKQVKDQAEAMLAFHQLETERAINLLLERSLQNEKSRLLEILGKITLLGVEVVKDYEINESDLLSDDDLDFLEQIAKRVILQNIEEATILYRFLITIDMSYTLGWIGLAVCYQEAGFYDIAEYTYELALKFLSFDYLLCLYASEFFILIGKHERAKEILTEAKNELINQSKIDSYTYSQVSNMLDQIQTLKTS